MRLGYDEHVCDCGDFMKKLVCTVSGSHAKRLQLMFSI